MTVTIPRTEERGIATFFNRAVVSSQAFSSRFGDDLSEDDLPKALGWLANGLETTIPSFLTDNARTDGAIYHLTDKVWVVPTLRKVGGEISLVFNQTKKDDANASVVEEIGERGGFTLTPRTRAKIMHNKFLVRREAGKPVAVLTGSANFTTEGLTTQANVLHIFRSPKLARIYLERKELLEEDPTIGATAKEAGWSERVRVGDAKVSVFFPPEQGHPGVARPRGARVKRARGPSCSAVSRRQGLRDACFEAGDRGRMMFGVVNTISGGSRRASEGSGRRRRWSSPSVAPQSRRVRAQSLRGAGLPGRLLVRDEDPPRPGRKVSGVHPSQVRRRGRGDGRAHDLHGLGEHEQELALQQRREPPGDHGVAASGADVPGEFMRLYERYRAAPSGSATWKDVRTFAAPGLEWTGRAYTRGTPEYRSRVSMVGG